MTPILAGFIRILRLTLDFLSELVFGFIFSKRGSLPPIRSPLLLDSAETLATKIRTRKITCKAVVSGFIDRIQQVNGIINCVVDSRFEEALEEAQNVDDLISRASSTDIECLAREKPFLGVPFTCKDCFETKGLSWTAGLLSRKGVKGAADAPVVARMKNAGAILLAVSNVSELCMWMESSNTVYGTSRNPYHIGRIVGGSSGGEGGLLAAACSPFGIGSDIGGSIRMPCFFNGIFGHKPSTGIVPNDGQLPPAHGLHKVYLVTGPMCRDARDLTPMFKVLAGPEKSRLLQLDEPVDLSRLKFYYAEDDGGFPLVSPVHAELKAAQQRFLSMLSSHCGVAVEKLSLPLLFSSLPIWTASMSAVKEGPSFCAHMKDQNGEVNPFWELGKWFLGLSDHTLPAIALGLAEKGTAAMEKKNQEFVKMGEELKFSLNKILGDHSVLVYPSHSTPAPYHHQPIVKTFNFAYTGIFNILGLPVTQVPLGLGSWGVPLGLQVVGGLHQDRNTLAVAIEAQRIFGGWVPPSTLD